MSDVRKNIVMVDDDPEDILLVKTALRHCDLPVSFVALSNGEALLDFFAAKLAEPNGLSGSQYLILLDLNMPKMDGRKSLASLRHHFAEYDLPVVIFSTSSADDDIVKSYGLGANAHVSKPDDIQELEHLMGALYRFWLA